MSRREIGQLPTVRKTARRTGQFSYSAYFFETQNVFWTKGTVASCSGRHYRTALFDRCNVLRKWCNRQEWRFVLRNAETGLDGCLMRIDRIGLMRIDRIGLRLRKGGLSGDDMDAYVIQAQASRQALTLWVLPPSCFCCVFNMAPKVTQLSTEEEALSASATEHTRSLRSDFSPSAKCGERSPSLTERFTLNSMSIRSKPGHNKSWPSLPRMWLVLPSILYAM